VQQLSHLPVIVDPSHSAGHRYLVLPLSRAAIAAGADGLIVEMHPDPALALCDGMQALQQEDVGELARAVADFSRLMGRRLAVPEELTVAAA
jgi:3-deoxy-7-phosphoheptulonate synthase